MKPLNLPRKLLMLTSLLSLSGCETYHLSTQSLLQQFANVQKQKHSISDEAMPMNMVQAFFYSGSVEGNDLKSLRCLDEKGDTTKIDVTNHTGIRITKNDNSTVTFYFNTLLIKDSTITGSKTHFFEAHIKPILLKNIAKIELQE